jgi:hypothetical protein
VQRYLGINEFPPATRRKFFANQRVRRLFCWQHRAIVVVTEHNTAYNNEEGNTWLATSGDGAGAVLQSASAPRTRITGSNYRRPRRVSKGPTSR